jgi:hypothetical protein
MSDAAAQKRRLNFYKNLLVNEWGGWNSESREETWPDVTEFVTEGLKCDSKSLEKAAHFFGLDHTHPDDLSKLAHILAEEVFGARRRGRKTGGKIWNSERYLELGFRYQIAKRENPKLSDVKISEIMGNSPQFREYKNNPEQIRQKFPQARRKYEDWRWEFAEQLDMDPEDPGFLA